MSFIVSMCGGDYVMLLMSPEVPDATDVSPLTTGVSLDKKNTAPGDSMSVLMISPNCSVVRGIGDGV